MVLLSSGECCAKPNSRIMLQLKNLPDYIVVILGDYAVFPGDLQLIIVDCNHIETQHNQQES